MRWIVGVAGLGMLLGSSAMADEAAEMRWTKVGKTELDGFQGSAGNVRINNVVLGRREGSDPAGAATEHEFSASIANRTEERLRVVLQVVGVTPEGTPTLSAESYVDVDAHRNEQIRQSFRAGPEALTATQAVWVHVSAAPP